MAHCGGLLQAGYWREYADHVMATGDEAAVKAVFSRCLLTCLSVDLWRAYLNFIKRVRVQVQSSNPGCSQPVAGLQVHAGVQQARRAGTMLTLPPLGRPLSPCRALSTPPQLNEPRGAAGLPEIRQAFEFTLDRLGQDSGCGAIWQDYIAFLQVRRGVADQRVHRAAAFAVPAGEAVAAAATAACHKRSQAETSWAVPKGHASLVPCRLHGRAAPSMPRCTERHLRARCGRGAALTTRQPGRTSLVVRSAPGSRTAEQVSQTLKLIIVFALHAPAALLLQEESGKVAAVRRGYQRALLVPSPQVSTAAATSAAAADSAAARKPAVGCKACSAAAPAVADVQLEHSCRK